MNERNGYVRLLLTAMLAASLGVVLYAVFLSLVTDTNLDVQDFVLLAIPTGLISYALRVLVGVGPWMDISKALRRLLGERRERG